MHLDIMDPFHSGESPLHLVDARVKLVLAIAFILAVALVPLGMWPEYILLLALIVAVAIVSDLGAAFAIKRAFIVIPFVISALPLLFTTAGSPTLTIRPFGWSLSVTSQGIARFVSIVLKSWISVQAGILLAATTPFPQLLMAMRAIRIPRLLVSIFGLMWRYMFVLADEAMRLMRARDARSGSETGKGGGRLAWRAKVTGSMAGSLFLRGYERSERIYAAMVSRGYDGEIRSLPLHPLSMRDRVALVGGLGLLLFIVTMNTFLT